MQAFGPMWEDAFLRLIKPIIRTGLSDSLTKALQKVARKLPNTVPVIRQHLLLPVLSALPVSSAPAPTGAQNGAGVAVSAGRAAGATARACFQVRNSLLSPKLLEFSQQVHAQVWPIY